MSDSVGDRNSDETAVNTNTISTNGRQHSKVGKEFTESVEMKTSISVFPSSQDGEGGERESKTGTCEGIDVCDGLNPLTPEAFAPLLSSNQYTVRKLAAHAMMDVALMMANISQLRTLIAAGSENMDYKMYYALISLVSFSLLSQVVFAVLIFIIFVREDEQQMQHELSIKQVVLSRGGDKLSVEEKRQQDFKEHKITNRLNCATIALVFLITVANMFITGFGIQLDTDSPTPNAI